MWKSTSQSAFSTPRIVTALLLCGATACSVLTGASLAFFRSDVTAKASHRTLTFAERVAYQRAIEEVYWRHHIWPKERPDPKPSLGQVVPSAQLEKKVEDYLRNSQVLEDYWQRPLSGEQLQAEMQRIAQHTKQPEEADLQAHPTVEQMKQTSGKYSEIEMVKSDSAQQEDHRGAEHSLKLNSREWDQTVQKLAAMFGAANNGGARHQPARRGVTAAITQIETGVLSPLQEDEGRYYATAVIEKTNERLKLATVEWRKDPLESWQARCLSHWQRRLVTIRFLQYQTVRAGALMILGQLPLVCPTREQSTPSVDW